MQQEIVNLIRSRAEEYHRKSPSIRIGQCLMIVIQTSIKADLFHHLTNSPVDCFYDDSKYEACLEEMAKYTFLCGPKESCFDLGDPSSRKDLNHCRWCQTDTCDILHEKVRVYTNTKEMIDLIKKDKIA